MKYKEKRKKNIIENMSVDKSMKDIIVLHVTRIMIALGVTLTVIMIVASMLSTISVLKDSLRMSARTSAQNISSNLHLLADRLDSIAQEAVLSDDSATQEQKQAVINERKQRVEFSWIAGYDLSGSKIFGDPTAPDSIADAEYFAKLVETENITIGEPQYQKDSWQICLGMPLMKPRNKGVYAYLVGSYDYGMLNDVLSNISIGKSGSAMILNADGVVIADKNLKKMAEKRNIYEMYTSKANHKVFDTVLAFQTGAESVFLKGKQSYMAYSPVAGTNWTLVISAPGADFMGILLISIIVCIIVTVMLQVTARKIIVKVASRITTSVSQAAKRLTTLSNGNLQEEVVLDNANQEAGILTAALSKTVTGLADYIEHIRSYLGMLSEGDYSMAVPEGFDGDFIAIRDALSSISESLNNTMYRINSASVAVSGNSSETSVHARKLYDGSQEQTEALERLSNRIDEISQKINAIDDNAQHVKLSADTADEKVEHGKMKMDSMLDTMNSINNDMQKIVTISNLIEEISSQTSLLALNASIEAARAGESGKGFAVVAQEIGVLAEQTADALRQTGEIINQVKTSIDNGLETAHATGEAFENVRQATDEFAVISDEMMHIAAEQKEKIQIVTEEVGKVLEIANLNQTLAKETDEIAEQSLKQAEELENIVSAVRLRKE